MKIWVDDIRPAPEGYIHFETVVDTTDYSYENFAGSVSFVLDNEKLTAAEKKAFLGKNAMAPGFGRKK